MFGQKKFRLCKRTLLFTSLLVIGASVFLTACGKMIQKNDNTTNVDSSTNEIMTNEIETNEVITNEAMTSADGTITFLDALCRQVTLNQPKKVAALMGSFAEIWLLAGGELTAVTQEAFDERNLELPKNIVQLGSLKAPNMEKLIEADIDFVILSSNVSEHLKLKDTLEAAGITSAYFEVESFEDYLNMLKTCTMITGNSENYIKNGEQIKEKIDSIIANIPKSKAPTVLFLRAFSSGIKAKGSDNMTGIMLKDLGCINIADRKDSLLEDLNMETIIEEDPDFIFVVTMGSSSEKALETVKENLISNPAWGELSAVKNDQYIVLPKELFHLKPNARWGESYEILAEYLYGTK